MAGHVSPTGRREGGPRGAWASGEPRTLGPFLWPMDSGWRGRHRGPDTSKRCTSGPLPTDTTPPLGLGREPPGSPVGNPSDFPPSLSSRPPHGQTPGTQGFRGHRPQALSGLCLRPAGPTSRVPEGTEGPAVRPHPPASVCGLPPSPPAQSHAGQDPGGRAARGRGSHSHSHSFCSHRGHQQGAQVSSGAPPPPPASWGHEASSFWGRDGGPHCCRSGCPWCPCGSWVSPSGAQGSPPPGCVGTKPGQRGLKVQGAPVTPLTE